jgi:hypothetical protein
MAGMAPDPTPRQWFLRSVAFLLGLFVLALGRCWVYDPSGSGATRYLVGARGDCWTARRGRVRLEGCVALRDRYPFVDSAYSAWELQ